MTNTAEMRTPAAIAGVIGDPELTQRMAERTASRVTIDKINAKITDATYILHGVLTICVLTLANGFKVVGKAAPASVENFDEAIGRRFAYDDAIKQVWPLEGYLLCEMIAAPRYPTGRGA